MNILIVVLLVSLGVVVVAIAVDAGTSYWSEKHPKPETPKLDDTNTAAMPEEVPSNFKNNRHLQLIELGLMRIEKRTAGHGSHRRVAA